MNLSLGKRAHNKKRNAGLIYEWLVLKVSSALVEGDNKSSGVALRMIKKYFKPGTELYKEFRLVNALMKTRVTSQNTASMIMNEARAAARKHNVPRLQQEKSYMIGEINRAFGDDFYEQHVAEYKEHATVQTLINDWRQGDHADLQRLAAFEDHLIERLTSKPVEPEDAQLSEHDNGTNRLLERVMMKKLNEKYAGLNSEQKSLIREYAWPSDGGKKLTEFAERLCANVIAAADKAGLDGEYVNKQLDEVKQLASAPIGVIDDATLERLLVMSKLYAELREGNSSK